MKVEDGVPGKSDRTIRPEFRTLEKIQRIFLNEFLLGFPHICCSSAESFGFEHRTNAEEGKGPTTGRHTLSARYIWKNGIRAAQVVPQRWSR